MFFFNFFTIKCIFPRRAPVSHSVTSWDLVKVSFLHAYDSLVFYIYTV